MCYNITNNDIRSGEEASPEEISMKKESNVLDAALGLDAEDVRQREISISLQKEMLDEVPKSRFNT